MHQSDIVPLERKLIGKIIVDNSHEKKRNAENHCRQPNPASLLLCDDGVEFRKSKSSKQHQEGNRGEAKPVGDEEQYHPGNLGKKETIKEEKFLPTFPQQDATQNPERANNDKRRKDPELWNRYLSDELIRISELADFLMMEKKQEFPAKKTEKIQRLAEDVIHSSR